jgi:hypothetical protein
LSLACLRHTICGMCGCLGTCTCPARSAVSASQALAAKRAATPRRLGHLVNFGSPAVPSPEQRPDRHRATSSPRRSGVLIGSRRSRRCGSQKWEPTCLAALGRSTTQSDSSRRSVTLHSTQSDGDRRPDPLWISLTRKRSLVQIQYGPRHFSKTCLVLGTQMGASDLEFVASLLVRASQ